MHAATLHGPREATVTGDPASRPRRLFTPLREAKAPLHEAEPRRKVALPCVERGG